MSDENIERQRAREIQLGAVAPTGSGASRPHIVIVADAIKRMLASELDGVTVRRSWRGDVDVSDEETDGVVVTVMPDTCYFDATRSRDSLWQNAFFLVAVTKNLEPERVGTEPLGEGWNDQVDEPAGVVEKLLEIFAGGRLVTADSVGDLDVTLVKSETDGGDPLCDVEELIERQRFLGLINVHARWEVPRSPMRLKGSA